MRLNFEFHMVNGATSGFSSDAWSTVAHAAESIGQAINAKRVVASSNASDAMIINTSHVLAVVIMEV